VNHACVIIVFVKITRYSLTAIIVVVSFIGLFVLVIGFCLKESTKIPNNLATFSAVDLSGVLPETGLNLIGSTQADNNRFVETNDPFVIQQWALSNMNITDLWSRNNRTKEIVVAILDTGIDSNHEDLKDKVIAEINLTDSHTVNDLNGHGTHIAGIICAAANNGVGITGIVPECKLLNVKVADDDGFCQAAIVAQGIVWAIDNGAKVINISLEIRNPSIDLEKAVNYAWEHGALIISAAGNQGNSSAVYPAYYENSIAVAGIKPDNSLAPLSNFGDWVDVAAPGYNIYSSLPGNQYGYETGTSFATAYVSGFAAFLLNVVSDTNGDGCLNDEVRNAIEKSCRPMSNTSYSFGILDAKYLFN